MKALDYALTSKTKYGRYTISEWITICVTDDFSDGIFFEFEDQKYWMSYMGSDADGENVSIGLWTMENENEDDEDLDADFAPTECIWCIGYELKDLKYLQQEWKKTLSIAQREDKLKRILN